MKRWILHIHDYLRGHKAFAWMLLAAVTALCAISALRLRYSEDISAFLPMDSQTARYESVYKRMGSERKVAVFFESEDNDAAIAAMDDFTGRWDTSAVVSEDRDRGAFQGVDAPRPLSSAGNAAEASGEPSTPYKGSTDASAAGSAAPEALRGAFQGVDAPRSASGAMADAAEVFAFVSANYPRFLTESDYARMDSLLALPGYIDRKIVEDKAEMYTAVTAMQTKYLRGDPLGLFPQVLERLRELNPTAGSRIIDGHIFTADGRTGVILFDSPYDASESALNAPLAKAVADISAETAAANPSVHIYSTGVPLISVQNSQQIKKDSFLAIGIALLLISLVLWFSFKRGADVLWIAISIGVGAVFALGLIALFKTEISIIILGIGSMIIGIAVNYPLHYVDHLKYRKDRRETLAEQINPLLVGNITTVGAFLSMMLLRSGALKDFGFIAAMMLVGTILFVLFFLPVFIPETASPRNTLRLDFDRHINLPPLWRKLGFLLFAAVTIFLGIQSRKVSFDADMHHINYITREQDNAFETLAGLGGSREGTETIFVVAEDESEDAAIALAEKLAATLPEGCSGSSITAFLPSLSTQQERSRRWARFREEHPALQTELLAAARREGFSDSAFQPFIDLLNCEFEPESAGYFEPVTAPAASAMLLRSYEGTGIVNYVNVPSGSAETAKAAIREHLPEGALCFNESDVSIRLVDLLSEDFDHIGLLCSLIVFIFLTLSFARLELSILSFLPLAVSWWWILGIMHLGGLQFNIINIILATFIFGQGDDYTIFITEGLMYERSTGKKILPSYKNCVMLSALIMFIGIGSLIVAKHPAMRSLAELTIIGMFTVVAMAYYIPPLVFRFLTEKKGKPRRVPVTLGSFLRTVLMSVSYLLYLSALSLYTLFYFLFNGDKDRFHNIIQKYSGVAIKLIPGVKLHQKIPEEEDFSKPAVLICNHQSHLDVLALLRLTPKLILLTNDWVWNSPFYGYIIHKAEFYPVSNGFDKNLEALRELVARGYSVAIFPEGTRSADCTIGRFHRGPFTIAKALGLDILPCYIHGFGYALPKLEYNLRRADMYLEVGERIPCSAIPEDLKTFTKDIRRNYVDVYSRIRRERETAEYLFPLVKAQYIYKGADAERASRLSREQIAEIDAFEGDSAEIHDAGFGAYALLLALSHPDVKVTAYIADEHQFLTASRCEAVPSNLSYILGE
ncbi:MAG: 1-acyl-sn-glycerol-3-phosphate acyltransferase [Bacteroidales bacterium]|nr:1-acyl-sn-glycerol-3-phosphate acyltransferase [Bacteroidales bacterium]